MLKRPFQEEWLKVNLQKLVVDKEDIMYINPFVAGVLATIGAELLIIVLGAIITVIKKG